MNIKLNPVRPKQTKDFTTKQCLDSYIREALGNIDINDNIIKAIASWIKKNSYKQGINKSDAHNLLRHSRVFSDYNEAKNHYSNNSNWQHYGKTQLKGIVIVRELLTL